jgi:hypothetical protein
MAQDGQPAGQDARLWSLDVSAGPGELDAKGVSHTSLGQRPRKSGLEVRSQANGLLQASY